MSPIVVNTGALALKALSAETLVPPLPGVTATLAETLLVVENKASTASTTTANNLLMSPFKAKTAHNFNTFFQEMWVTWGELPEFEGE